MKGRFLRKILSVTMALAVTAGMMCIGAVTARGAEVDVVPLNAVQKLTNNSTISSTLISKGETLTVNAQAGGGQGGYTYAVLYRKKTDKDWTVRQGYKDNATIIVKPAKDTDYDVCVKVKDISGTIAKKFFEIKVNPKLQNDSAISKTTIRQGDTVTVTAKGTGGVGNYTYAVLYKKQSDKSWTVRQGYKDNARILVRPAKATEYSICVKVKDEHGIIAKKFFTVNVRDYVKDVINLVNAERQKEGISPLKENKTLSEAAQKRAEEISEQFEHTRPDGTLCFTVLNEYGIKFWGAAENIAAWQSTPESVMNTWMNSDEHKSNILNTSMTDIGVGLYEKNGRKYWVQLFIKSA